MDFLIQQPRRNVSFRNTKGESLRDGGFSHARLANQAGIVLRTAGKDRYHAVNLPIPSDDAIHLPPARLGSQVGAVGIQKLALLFLFLPRLFRGSRSCGRAFRRTALPVRHVAEQILQKREGRRAAGRKAILPVFPGIHQLAELLVHLFHIFVGNSKFIQQVVHRLDPKLLGADQTESVVDRLVPFHPGDKDDRRTFFAA